MAMWIMQEEWAREDEVEAKKRAGWVERDPPMRMNGLVMMERRKPEPGAPQRPLRYADMDAAARNRFDDYVGSFFHARRHVVEELLTLQHDQQWTLAAFVDLVTGIQADIPSDAVATATVKYTNDYHGDASFTISYVRRETEAEFQERMDEALERFAERDASDLAHYRSLKERFGD